jgi:hypothetical protein
MKRTKDRTKATLDRTSDTTGRDGAIDLIAKVESSVILDQRDDDPVYPRHGFCGDRSLG